MATNTPHASLRDRCDPFVQRKLDEVSNERDTAISRLGEATTIIKKLKSTNTQYWDIITNKQNETNTLYAQIAALHDENRQLKRTLGEERLEFKNKRTVGSSTANNQDTTFRRPHDVTTSLDTPSDAVQTLPVSNGVSHRAAITVDQITSEVASWNRTIQYHNAANRTTVEKCRDLDAEVTTLKQNYDLAVKAHECAMRIARETQEHLNSEISKLERQVNFVTDKHQRAIRHVKDLTVQLDGLQHRMDETIDEYDAAMEFAAYEKARLRHEAI